MAISCLLPHCPSPWLHIFALCVEHTGNWIGSCIMASTVAASGLFSATGNSLPIDVTLAKTSIDFQTNFIRGVLCNGE